MNMITPWGRGGAALLAGIASAAAFDLETTRPLDLEPLVAPPQNAFTTFGRRGSGVAAAEPVDTAKAQRLQNVTAKLPLHFEPLPSGTAGFVSRGGGYALFVTPGEAVLWLNATQGTPASTVRLKFAGANTSTAVEAIERLPGVSNHYRGSDRSKWRVGVPHFAKVRQREIYPGIDLVFYGRGRELEYDLIVAPGADPQQIRMELEGADTAALDAAGNLVLQTAAGALRLRKPYVYQEAAGQRQEIESRFVFTSARTRSSSVGFAVAKYDAARPLVIDPIFDFGAGFGGTMRDEGFGVATGPGGAIYVAGSTSSADFPVSVMAEQASRQGTLDAYLSILSRDGESLISSTYFGGSENDEALAVAVDQFGIAYLTGYTQSADFPAGDSLLNPYGGSGDAFIAAFDLTGARIYSAFFGGSNVDQGIGVAVDPGGSVYVTGWTRSGNLPVLNAFQPANAGGIDRFVFKLNPAGTSLVYSTYLGTPFDEYAANIQVFGNNNFPSGGIAVDAAGHAYVTGATRSVLFPTVNGFQTSGAGVFISKFHPSGASLTYSSTIGPGSGCAIAVHPSGASLEPASGRATGAINDGRVLLTGVTLSENFPTRLAQQDTYGGSGDAFLAEIDTTLSGNASLIRSTYLGGDGYDAGYGVEYVRLTGGFSAVVAGKTNSTNFPYASQPSGGSILKSTDGGATWTKANRGLTSAGLSTSAVRVLSMAVDPTNPLIAYAGTAGAGIFWTTDGGSNWSERNNGLPVTDSFPEEITELEVDPRAPETVYAGTGQSGIYISRNQGFAWEPSNDGLQTNAPFVAFAFGETGVVYAGSDFNGLFKSMDNGMSWTAMNNGLMDRRIQTIAVDPKNLNTLYVGTGFRDPPVGIYRSDNAAATWTHQNGNLASLFGPTSSSDINIAALAFTSSSRLLALIEADFERIGGLASSTDGGSTWSTVARFGDPDSMPDPIHGVRSLRARTLWVDPEDEDNIVVGTRHDSGRGLIRTGNGGATWQVTGGVGADVNELRGPAGTLFAGVSGGNDGFLTTLPLQGVGSPATSIIGETGQEELRSVRSNHDIVGELFDEAWDAVFAGTSSSVEISSTPEALAPPPNSIPPGPVIPPGDPQNTILGAEPNSTPPPMRADLSIEKELSIYSFFGQQGVLCRIVIRNNGPDTAPNVKVDDHGSTFKTPVDESFSDFQSTASPANANTRVYDLGEIPAGSTKVITLLYPVYGEGFTQDRGKTRANTAQVYIPFGSNVRDPNAGNDRETAVIDIPETPPQPVVDQTANQSTRVVAGTGDRVAITGTIITAPSGGRALRASVTGGTARKKVIFRAIGPSMTVSGQPVAGRLEDPRLELYDSSRTLIGRNDDWRQTQLGGVITSDQVGEIQASQLAPTSDLESAIIADLPPGEYTAIIRGAGSSTGISLAEVYDLAAASELRLGNTSTRGFVDTEDNVMIGGVILIGAREQRMVFRAIGPSLTDAGVAGALADPTLSLHNENGALIATNDNWQSDQEEEIIATTIPPSKEAEAAIVAALRPGAYTAIVRGKEGSTGVALVEVYNLGPEPPPPSSRP